MSDEPRTVKTVSDYSWRWIEDNPGLFKEALGNLALTAARDGWQIRFVRTTGCLRVICWDPDASDGQEEL